MKKSAFEMIATQPWAMLPETLETIATIARRENESPEAVAAKLGRPLQNTRTVTVRDGVAIVPVTGPIFRYANMFTEVSGATSLDVLVMDHVKAFEDGAIKAVVSVYDTPGGLAASISEAASTIRAAATKSGKPWIAYIDNMAASAGYWMAAPADEIVVSKTGEVGSVGAVVGISTKKDDGVMEIVSSQSPKKRPDITTDEGRQQIQERIDELAQVFVEDVANYRGVSAEKVLADFGQGDMRMGAKAVSLGMADRVSTLEEVIAGLSGSAKTGDSRMANTEPKPAEPVINREYLAEHHKDVVSAIEGDAVKAERARVQGIIATPLADVYGELMTSAIADGKTPEQFAVAILAEEGKARTETFEQMKAEAPKPVPEPVEPEPVRANAPIEERARAQWDKSHELRDEFGGKFETYLAYASAEDAGRVKILGK